MPAFWPDKFLGIFENLGGSKIPEETSAANMFRVFVSFAQFPKAFLDAQAVVALSSPAPGSRVKLP